MGFMTLLVVPRRLLLGQFLEANTKLSPKKPGSGFWRLLWATLTTSANAELNPKTQDFPAWFETGECALSTHTSGQGDLRNRERTYQLVWVSDDHRLDRHGRNEGTWEQKPFLKPVLSLSPAPPDLPAYIPRC